MNRNVLKSFEIAPGIHGSPTFPQWSNALWDQGYTGPTIVHWLHGRPQMIEMVTEEQRLVISHPKPKKDRPREFQPHIQPSPAPWNRK